MTRRMLFNALVVLIQALLTIPCLHAETYSQSLYNRAKNGNAEAQYQLGRCYKEGDGIDSDRALALQWMEKAANNGHTKAMVALGELCCSLYDLYEGPNFIDAFKWYRNAAKKGNPEAIEFISEYTKEREEVNRECPLDFLPCNQDFFVYDNLINNKQRILEEYNKKNCIAMYYLAVIAYGERKFEEAVKYLEEAYPLLADLENEYDFGELGEYSSGIGERIHMAVTSLLGWCYEYGLGVEKNIDEALKYYWYSPNDAAYYVSIVPGIRGDYCLKKNGQIDDFIKMAYEPIGCVNMRNIYCPCLLLELAEMYAHGDGVEKNQVKPLNYMNWL